MLEKIKAYINKVLNQIKKKPKQKKRVDASHIEDINEELENALNNAKADNAMLKQQLEKLRKAHESEEEVNIGKKLQEEQKKLSNKSFQGAISFRKLFRLIEKKEKSVRGESVEAESKLGGEDFGDFVDIWGLNNGQMAAVVRNNGHKKPIITGRTLPELFRNYKNLPHSVQKGVVFLNLDEDGNYSENIERKKVPNVKLDANGNFIHTQTNQGEFMKILAEKERKLNKLRSQLKASDQAWVKENEDRKSIQDYSDVMKKKYDARSAALTDELEKTKNVLEENRIKRNEKHNLMNALNMSEDYEDFVDKRRDELLEKVADMIPETKESLAEGRFKSLASWIQNEMAEPMAEKMYVEKVKKKQEEEVEEEEETGF